MEPLKLGEETERKKHQQSIEDLCRLLEMPMEKISAAYAQELEMMRHTAKIKEFLPILVSRKVKSFLRRP
ncbi:Protein of unknown function [Syntrophus gentianae]|uniref:DUF3562 domain-containing protein n=1 Tax=Syntrophus gentianae TaxID=43775 RepID=A0A1H7WVL5_9BACT|nr:DUF3562 domain-containing protein [Syntrophus gentianae]SEM25424.1 Protein of unknown function [Syntrophus gentianae]